VNDLRNREAVPG